MQSDIRQRVSLLNPIHFLALGFGSGLAPKAPGTFGTLAAVPLVVLLGLFTPLYVYLGVTLLVCVLGVYLCGVTARDMQVHDDSSIVWDEIAGLLITMIAVPISWQSVLVGFLLFRLFDIAKPWPIGFIDKRLHGGLGIMLDDIIAGLMALAGTHLFIYWL